MTPTDLSNRLQLLVTPSYQPELEVYLSLLTQCVKLREFRAAVFIFDQIKDTFQEIPENAYTILDPLHSKTVPESSQVKVPVLDPSAKTLAPRRRIHKIMKGYQIRQTNQTAAVYLPKVKGFLECHSNYKTLPRIPLAKRIATGCHLDFNTSRRIVTKLRQTGFLPKEDQCYIANQPKYDWSQHTDSDVDTKIISDTTPINYTKPVLPKGFNSNLGTTEKKFVQTSITSFFGGT